MISSAPIATGLQPSSPQTATAPSDVAAPPQLTPRRQASSLGLSPRTGASRTPEAAAQNRPRLQTLPPLRSGPSDPSDTLPAPVVPRASIEADPGAPPPRDATSTAASVQIPAEAARTVERLRDSRDSLRRMSTEPDRPGGSTAHWSLSTGPGDIESLRQAQAPRPASGLAFFAAQNLRHAGPVAVVRTLVQGLAAPALARAVETHPAGALAAQTMLAAVSLARRALSQLHSESRPEVANRSFAGHAEAPRHSSPRRLWQAVQTVGIVAGDVSAVALTAASLQRPELKPLAQSLAAVQLRAHLLSQLREFFRPTINTVHVGNRDPQVPQAPEGRNLRSEDVTGLMKLQFGGAATAIEFGAQMLGQLTLGGQHAWDASKGLAVAAAGIAGIGNMVSSSVEDHLVENAAARRMQRTDPSHVPHIHFESKNPLQAMELGRQFERVDARVFNQMVPAMLAIGVLHGLQQVLETQVPAAARPVAQAAVNAILAGVVLGGLLALTVKSYQLNDGVRHQRAHSHG